MGALGTRAVHHSSPFSWRYQPVKVDVLHKVGKAFFHLCEKLAVLDSECLLILPTAQFSLPITHCSGLISSFSVNRILSRDFGCIQLLTPSATFSKL